MHFDFIDLRLLVAVLETGSITAGGERVGLSLAAASARMRGLEQQAGVALLTRNPRGVQATPAGERLLQHARVLLQQRDRLRGDMAEFAPGQRSQLRIVANTVAADAFLPELLADFLVLHPHTDIALEELPSPAIALAIAEWAADIGIVADHADLRGLASYPFRQDRLVLALPPGHALSGRRSLSFADALPLISSACRKRVRCNSIWNSWRYAAAARCGCGRVRLISTPSAAWCCAAPGWRWCRKRAPNAIRKFDTAPCR